ncbi:hypothetical protein F4777DRAFT_593631 [Nemania sp. FL0916]|nr:hypothetical protein F4777DRAFT_593631 [Nemania sp. FL0916]
MAFRYGMNQVFSPLPSVQPVANIVFLHGLFGSPGKTFVASPEVEGSTLDGDASNLCSPTISSTSSQTAQTLGSVFWPQDLLPERIPNANVFSFGYDADVGRFMDVTGSNCVHDHGRNLLNSLSNIIDDHVALNQSAHTVNKELSRVLKATHGIIFLATPHRGSRAATYGRLAFSLTQGFVFPSANINLISSLERGSGEIARISDEFIETLATARHLELCSFAEEKPIKFGWFSLHIVPHESAKIGHEREHWGTISGNHREIAKYSNAADEGFIKVTDYLKRWMAAAAEDRYLECLESLNDPNARLRLQEVSHASHISKASFGWLFSPEAAYAKWLADDGSLYGPIFWITGKPGSGKSALIQFAFGNERSESLLPLSRGRPMAYFFHLRGKSLVQNSLHGMLQELLYQTLKQFPSFYKLLKPIYQKARLNADGDIKWDLSSLSEGFRLLPYLTSSDSTCRPRIFLYIDALDENRDHRDNKELVGILEDIVSTYEVQRMEPGAALLKICLASRPWPIFQMAYGNRPRVPFIAMTDFTETDIRTYTECSLKRALSGTRYSEDEQQIIVGFASEITNRAQGVFVWVRIVVESLFQQIIDGTPLERLRKILTDYPLELDELYEHTIQRIPQAYRLEAEIALKVVLQSRTQLTLGELYVICSICSGTPVSHSTAQDASASWLASRCGGLVETVAEVQENGNQSLTKVQFIHQTVQDFVRHGIKGISDNSDINLVPEICGSHLLAFACTRNHQRYPDLSRVRKNLFCYLRDIEQTIDYPPNHRPSDASYSGQTTRATTFDSLSYELSNQPPSPRQPAFNLESYQPHNLLRNFQWDDPAYLDDEMKSELKVAVGIRTNRPRSVIRANHMPILQNLYHYGADKIIESQDVEHSGFTAALGPRTTTSRVDRLRMLSRVLTIHPKLSSTKILLESRRHDSVCDFIPHLDMYRGELSLLVLLVSAIPNDYINEDTLFKMTEEILQAGATTSERVPVRGLSRPDMSLLNYVVRFKEGRLGDWVQLLRKWKAKLSDDEVDWSDRVALLASLSVREYSDEKIVVTEEKSVVHALVPAGLRLVAGGTLNLSLSRACLHDFKAPKRKITPLAHERYAF